MAWTYLFIAGLLEIAWATGLKYTQQFTQFWPSVFTVIAMIASFWFLSKAVHVIPLGTAYAVWTGIGVLGTTIVGMTYFAEPRDTARVLSIGLIFIGIVGLKYFSP